MDYSEDNRAAGTIPDFGAIFMSNIFTKEVCFEHKIFALPSSKAEFVKHIKAGMVLFLFEFEKRQLFGVYKASSDGAMDIIPYAFNSSGRHLPAQVCFKPIWNCDPLSEKEFRDAIRENYFSSTKFNFGLSEDQVYKLLCLFHSRQLKIERFPHQPREAGGVYVKDRGHIGDGRFFLSETCDIEANRYNKFKPANLCDYRMSSLGGAKEDQFLMDDTVNAKDTLYPSAQVLEERRRIENDERLIMNSFVTSDPSRTLQTFSEDSPRDTVDALRRSDGTLCLSRMEMISNENRVGKFFNASLNSEYLSPLDAQSIDGQFTPHNKLFGEDDLETGSMLEFAGGSSRKPLDSDHHERFLTDDFVQRGSQSSMNGKFVKGYNMDTSNVREPFEPSDGLLCKIRKTTVVGNFPDSYRMKVEPNFDTYVESRSSENHSPPLHYGQRLIHDRRYPTMERRQTENTANSILSQSISTRNDEYFGNTDRQVLNYERFASTRKAGYCGSFEGQLVDDARIREGHHRIGHREDSHIHISPDILSKKIHNLSSPCDELVPEQEHSHLNVVRNVHPSSTIMENEIITRSIPYVPECPNLFHGCSSSLPSNRSSRLMQVDHYNHSSLGNLCSSRSSPHSLDTGPHECAEMALSTFRSGGQSSMHSEDSSSFVNSDLSAHTNPSPSVLTDNRGSLPSKYSLASPHENVIRQKGHHGYVSKSSKNHFVIDRNLIPASHMSQKDKGVVEKYLFWSKGEDFRVGDYYREKDHPEFGNQHFGISPNTNLKDHQEFSKAPVFNSSGSRKSVFTRLATGQESFVGEERNVLDECCANTSVDEVMHMLRQNNDQSPRKPKKLRVEGKLNYGEDTVTEKKASYHAEITKTELLGEAHSTIDEIPKETRVVDFRRRSDTKKAFNSTPAKKFASSKEAESGTKTSSKRKRLVRPVFGEVKSVAYPICVNQASGLAIPDKNFEKVVPGGEGMMPNDNCNKLSSKCSTGTDVGADLLPSSDVSEVGASNASS